MHSGLSAGFKLHPRLKSVREMLDKYFRKGLWRFRNPVLIFMGLDHMTIPITM